MEKMNPEDLSGSGLHSKHSMIGGEYNNLGSQLERLSVYPKPIPSITSAELSSGKSLCHWLFTNVFLVADTWKWSLPVPRIGSTTLLRVLLVLLNAPGVAARIDFHTVIAQSGQLSMSGVLGLLDTDLLFAEAGSSQPEHWRIVQGILGIGSLRVLSKICLLPCFEVLHLMHGINPPDALVAREFWLQQKAWTEIGALDMGQEDTSYHRINQGSGPQGKLLWNWEEIAAEQQVWGCRSEGDLGSVVSQTKAGEVGPTLRWGDVNITMQVAGKNREEITQGSADKWWMDRWQIEALAVASARNITLEDAANLLTTAYFGESTGTTHQLLAGIACIILTASTFTAAWFTNWSWISQLFALSSLGYFVNWTGSMRGWKFSPAHAARGFIPKIRTSWPTKQEMQKQDWGGAIRIAVQSSGVAHLRGVILIPNDVLAAARHEAEDKRGRYPTARKMSRKIPYGDERNEEERHWISFECQTSFYGILVSIAPDNVAQRSLGVLWTMVNGIILLILGFGASIPKGWSGYVLLFYISGIGSAIYGRRRGTTWTFPEFTKVDLTADPIVAPLSMRKRISGMPGTPPSEKFKHKQAGAIFFASHKTSRTEEDIGNV